MKPSVGRMELTDTVKPVLGLELLFTPRQPNEPEAVATQHQTSTRKHRAFGGDEKGQLADAINRSADHGLPAHVNRCGKSRLKTRAFSETKIHQCPRSRNKGKRQES